MNFLEFLKHKVENPVVKVAKVAEHIALEVAPIALPIALPEALPFSLPVSRALSAVFKTSIEGNQMNPLESFAITMVLGIIQSTVKNPAHKLALESQLIGIADLIYTEYGLAAPTKAPAIGQ